MENLDTMMDFTYRPKSDKKGAFIAMSALLAVALAVVVASVVSPSYKGVISLVAVILLCICVYIFVRYLASDYAYAVVNTDTDAPLLIVTRTVGKRTSTLSSIALSSVNSVEEIKGEPSRVRYERKYNFCQSFSPKLAYVLRVKTRYEQFTAHLEIPKEVADRLVRYIEIAKTKDTEEE